MKIKIKLYINVIIGFIMVVVILNFYSTFSLENTYSFSSLVYDINDKYIEGVSSNTSVDLYYKYFDTNNCIIKVVDKDNKTIKSGLVPSLSKTIVYNKNKKVICEYINIIKGDYNSDGKVNKSDLYDMEKCLNNSCNASLKIVDINLDSIFNNDDIVMLNHAINEGYTGIEIDKDSVVIQTNEITRLITNVLPSYGVNLNVKWSSSDNAIASVDDAGRVTGHKEGVAYIKASTIDNKYSKSILVKVDNTIKLDTNEGIGYLDGNDIIVGIKSMVYDNISCKVDNKSVANCYISNKNLILTLKQAGTTKVIVTSEKYGEVFYTLKVLSTNINIDTKYVCASPNDILSLTLIGLNTNVLSFEAEDSEIITNAYIDDTNLSSNEKMLRINFGAKEGRTILKVADESGNKTDMVVADVTSMSVSDIGKVAKVGEEIEFNITGNNLGILSCKSHDEIIATCRVEGNKLLVSTLKTGAVNIDIYNNFNYLSHNEICGQNQVIVVIEK